MKLSISGIIAVLVLSGCEDPEKSAREKVGTVGVPALRKAAGRLNRDHFAVPGLTFVTLKKSNWPAPFVQLQPRTVTVYRDGVAAALGGEAGTTEWGVFIVPPGLAYTPPTTKMIRYEKIEDGVFHYRSLRD